MSDFNGEIMIEGTEKILKYNIDDQEYWIEESKEYFKKLAKDINKENSNSTLLDSDDGENTPSIDRFSEKNIAHVHGYESKKWITSISNSDGKIVIQEWFVDKLPLLRLHDSLKVSVIESFHPDNSYVDENLSEFKSDLVIQEIGNLRPIDPIPGYPIKINFTVFTENSKRKFNMNYEISQLYAETVDTSFFTVPEEYKRITKRSD
tara:strand:+ start:90501 stop:91118 length:618 start_codon:yes stop_codon:yes gene_type:complete